jgi:phytoene dehydrogenase-like protein
VLTPLDLERRFGITGGNIFHGEMSLDQMFVLRPAAGTELRARYRTPGSTRAVSMRRPARIPAAA